ncbi:hypothetical protein Acr_00g0004320 [Actinidia rufa]|uniref:Uncharacterized protein n=1 Tax=Actinidia rufa TaxID=165716 RepID=A0A7J0D8T7_9ERIC|nr:hypothetical protein Acr_00g0004320 [Actinidia rufa]
MERGLPVLQIGTELETPQRMRFRLGNSFLSDLPHCRRKEPEQPLEEGNTAKRIPQASWSFLSLPADRRERSGIDSPITRLASATGKGTVAIASSPGQSSLPQRGVGSAKIDGKLPGLGFAISSVLSSVPCLDLFGFKVGVLFFHFQLRKLYTISENHVPQEIDMFTLNAMQTWDVNGAWDRPFTSHPKMVVDGESLKAVGRFRSAEKRASGTGELIIMGTSAMKPYYVLGVISADGKNLRHKVDLKFERCVLSHDIGITEKYNVIIDYPLIIDIKRVFKGGPLLKYYKDGQARFGVMPRYGDADSVQWFKVESHCTFHLFNTFEEGDEVVVRGCRALSSTLPGPEMEEGFLFTRVYEWRLNMVTGEVRERNLSGTYFSMDFPVVNADFIGLKHKYGYTQAWLNMEVLLKIYFDEPWATQTVEEGEPEQLVKVEHHKFPENSFCSGIVFVRKNEGVEEDDGWIVSYVHDEQTDESQGGFGCFQRVALMLVVFQHSGLGPVVLLLLLDGQILWTLLAQLGPD